MTYVRFCSGIRVLRVPGAAPGHRLLREEEPDEGAGGRVAPARMDRHGDRAAVAAHRHHLRHLRQKFQGLRNFPLFKTVSIRYLFCLT